MNNLIENFNDKHEILAPITWIILLCAGVLFILFLLGDTNNDGYYNDPSLYPYINSIEDYAN